MPIGGDHDDQPLADARPRRQPDIELVAPDLLAAAGVERNDIAVDAGRVYPVAVPHGTQSDAQELGIRSDVCFPEPLDRHLRLEFDQLRRFELLIIVTEQAAGGKQ